MQCVLTILDLTGTSPWDIKKTKINICHHMLTLAHTTAKQLISRCRKNENVIKMSKDEISTCKACKSAVFHFQICKFVGFWLPSSSWLLKLPSIFVKLAVKHVMSKQSSLYTSFFRSFVTGSFISLMALFVKCWMVMPVFFQNHSMISLFPSTWWSR